MKIISRYEYLGVFDVDEVIVPRNASSWKDMMAMVTKTSGSPVSWIFRNTYFFDEDPGLESDEELRAENIPAYHHMLRHIYRSVLYTELNYKSFMNPRRVLNIRSHEPIRCDGNCTSFTVDPSLAHLQHYRGDCVPRLADVCQEDFKDNTVRDTSLWVVKDRIQQRVEVTLDKLGYFAK